MADGLFTFNDTGWIEQHRSREPYEVAREPIQNALDTGADLGVAVDYDSNAVVVQDEYTDGVEDLEELMSVYQGDKGGDPEKRGRFGRGIKEFIAACDRVEIESTGGRMEIDIDYGPDSVDFNREQYSDGREIGTKVVGHREDWSTDELDAIVEFVDRIQVPEGRDLYMEVREDGDVMKEQYSHQPPDTIAEDVALQTVVTDNGVREKRHRHTTLEIRRDADAAGIYEMGIPVTDLDVPFVLDVQQKTPVAEQRNELPDRYQTSLARTVMEESMELLDDEHLTHEWFTGALATSTNRLDLQAQKDYLDRRFGDDIVVDDGSCPDHAIDKAENFGMTVLTTDSYAGSVAKLLRARRPTAQQWLEQFTEEQDITVVEPDPDQQEFLDYLDEEVIGRLQTPYLDDVRLAEITGTDDGRAEALYSGDDRTIYLNTLSDDWDGVTAPRMGTVIHEIAHANQPGEGHGKDWYEELDRLAGQLYVEALPDEDAALQDQLDQLHRDHEALEERVIEPTERHAEVREYLEDQFLDYTTAFVEDVRFADLKDLEQQAAWGDEVLYIDAAVEADETDIQFQRDLIGALGSAHAPYSRGSDPARMIEGLKDEAAAMLYNLKVRDGADQLEPERPGLLDRLRDLL